MRLNAIMALATVAGVVGVMGSAAVGSLSVRHHYFQGASQGGPAHHSVPVELTSQLTGGDETTPLAFMLLSDLKLLPAGKGLGPQGQSDADPASGGPMTSQFLASSFGDGGFGGGLGDLAPGQGAASASDIVQNGPPDVSQVPDTPPSAAPPPSGAPSFGGAGFVAPPAPPGGPGPPPTVDPLISGPPVVLPPIPPLFPDPAPPPSIPFAGPPQQDGGSSGPPAPRAISAVPEPATWLFLVLGLGLTGAVMPGRRYNRRRLPPPSAA